MAGYTKNTDGSYSVNYEDERFQDVKNEQAQQTTQTTQTYDNILNNSDQYYQNQINQNIDRWSLFQIFYNNIFQIFINICSIYKVCA